MRVSPCKLSPSPLGAGRLRLSVRVEYATLTSEVDELWFDVPETHFCKEGPLGNTWLACLLPLASKLNEPIELADPVDALLLEGAGEILRAWDCWLPDMHAIAIKATPVHPASIDTVRKTACFYSGGVDSFFSILWHDHPSSHTEPVDELVTVWGLDIPIDHTVEIDRARESLSTASRALNKPMVEVWTNVRETQYKRLDWYYGFGSVLASLCLVQEARYRRVYLPSAYSYKELVPCGSHMITDPMFSTSRLRIFHDAAGYSRMEKLAFLGKFDVAMKHLRVCWVNQAASNCGQCTKCWRTMIAMEILGILSQSSVFPEGSFTNEKLRNLKFESEKELLFLRSMLEAMPPDGNPHLRLALVLCIRDNAKRFSRIHRFEHLECLPRVGWLFGHYKRRFVTRKRLTPAQKA